ncbi:hypothetical protein [Phenylobacterium sp.]|uniref:hypothetical protein n=1 Tax=Phenylobacterium sp. TaxID=1871053 RepID=UPI003D2E2931
MHRLVLIAALAIPAPALPPPEPTHPGFLDAPRLQALCAAEGVDAAAGHALCLGYVTGVADSLLIPRAGGGGRPFARRPTRRPWPPSLR